jgi:hypothetical protein
VPLAGSALVRNCNALAGGLSRCRCIERQREFSGDVPPALSGNTPSPAPPVCSGRLREFWERRPNRCNRWQVRAGARCDLTKRRQRRERTANASRAKAHRRISRAPIRDNETRLFKSGTADPRGRSYHSHLARRDAGASRSSTGEADCRMGSSQRSYSNGVLSEARLLAVFAIVALRSSQRAECSLGPSKQTHSSRVLSEPSCQWFKKQLWQQKRCLSSRSSHFWELGRTCKTLELLCLGACGRRGSLFSIAAYVRARRARACVRRLEISSRSSQIIESFILNLIFRVFLDGRISDLSSHSPPKVKLCSQRDNCTEFVQFDGPYGLQRWATRKRYIFVTVSREGVGGSKVHALGVRTAGVVDHFFTQNSGIIFFGKTVQKFTVSDGARARRRPGGVGQNSARLGNAYRHGSHSGVFFLHPAILRSLTRLPELLSSRSLSPINRLAPSEKSAIGIRTHLFSAASMHHAQKRKSKNER